MTSTAPHLLYVMCDELRAHEVACYGHPAIRTPNIDALARRGTRFETAISNCPVCMPARSVVLSGQYARTCCGMLTNVALHPREGGWIMPQWPRHGRPHCSDPTLPEALAATGYRCHAIGKWHVEAWPHDIGFHDYTIPANQHANSAQWYSDNGGPPYVPQGYGLDHEITRATEVLHEAADDRQPRFIYLNLGPPHMPLMDAPQRYLDMYAREDVVLRPNVRPIGDDHETTERFLTYLWDYRHYRDRLPYACSLPEGCDITELHRLYMGLTTWIDDALGRILKALNETGLADRTVVVFTSDHGENLASHGMMGKLSPNEEAIRIPMVFAGPGIAQGHLSDRVASLVDIAPTLIDFARARPTGTMHGRSLADALSGGGADPETNHAWFETLDHGVGIRGPHHMVNLPWRDRQQPQWGVRDQPDWAFDLRTDPYQLQDPIPADPACRRLAELARTWDRSTAWSDAARQSFQAPG